MPRIFKGSEPTLKLLVGKTNEEYDNLRILLYTTDIDDAIEVIDGITLDGNVAEINLASRAFIGLEDGLIKYKVEYVINGDLFHTERESNYYLKSLSYVSENSAKQQILNITENGEYKITPNDGAYVTIRVDVLGYEQGITEGYNQGWADGYVSGETEGYNSGHTEGYDQGHSDGYQEGAEIGKAQVGAEAITLNVAENGTIYTKYADNIPEWNEPLTGDDFYSYAYMDGRVYDTGYQLTDDSVIEVWYKTSFNKSLNGKHIVFGVEDGVQLKYERTAPYWTLEYPNGVSVSVEDIMKFEEWVHIVLTKNKIIINNVEKEITEDVVFAGTSNFKIGGIDASLYNDCRGFYGMVKVNNNVFIPTLNGISNNGVILDCAKENISSNVFYEFYEIIRPTIYDNLIKQVNANVKIDMTGIKLGESQFSKVPDWIAPVKQSKDIGHMFNSCTSLSDISALAEWDTFNTTIMCNLFYYCSHLVDISPIANWDTSNVTNMSNMFANCAGLVDATPIANWDTSSVTTFESMFSSNTNLTTIPYMNCIKAESSTGYTNKFPIGGYSEFSKLTNVGGFYIKNSWNSNYGLNKCPNLTYESCINVLNALYDFTGNGETPTSTQGTLKVHSNFLNLVGDEISIATNKGWSIVS